MWYRVTDTPYKYLVRLKRELFTHLSVLELYKRESRTDANLERVTDIEELYLRLIPIVEDEIRLSKKFVAFHGGEDNSEKEEKE